MGIFGDICTLSSAPMDLLSRSRLQSTAWARLYSTAQVWVPDGLRGACFGRSKSRNLASNHGVAFRGDRAEHDNRKPTCQLFFSIAAKALYFVAATVQQETHITSSSCGSLVRVCGHCICLSGVCYDTWACV